MREKGDEHSQNSEPPVKVDCYIPVLHDLLDQKNITLRELAGKSKISKSRLGSILHRQPAKRSVMQMPEFLSILNALGIDIIHAWFAAKQMENAEVMQCKGFDQFYEFIVDFNVRLPELILSTPEMEGVEFRKDWSRPLAAMLVKRILEEKDRRARARDPFHDDLQD